jgi:hypothetical protein
MTLAKVINWLKLRLAREEPEVPHDGFTAWQEGFGFDDNPFTRHTPDHSIWRDDWLDANQHYRHREKKT